MQLLGKKIFLYMNFFVEDLSIGITKKIRAQINTLRRMGLEVYYTSYVEDGVVIYDNDDKVVEFKKYVVPFQIYKRYNRRFLLIKTATNYLKTSGLKFDFGYLRWHTFDKSYLEMLKALQKVGAINIVEAHAWTPNPKATSLIAKYQVYNDKKFSQYAKKYVALVAGMSEYDYIWGIKTVKIDNAVDLEHISQRVWDKKENVLRVVSVSNEYAYHGYDRLLKGMRNYYNQGGERQIEVHFVGVFLESTKKLCKELELDDRVYFHGKVFGEALDNIYNESDLGIGALAHHRVGMYAGSSLKTKEYFAKGLPFIYGWREPAFDNTYPYALQIQLCEEPLDMNTVIHFYDQIKNDKEMERNMREFARQHYSWENEFRKIFEAL